MSSKRKAINLTEDEPKQTRTKLNPSIETEEDYKQWEEAYERLDRRRCRCSACEAKSESLEAFVDEYGDYDLSSFPSKKCNNCKQTIHILHPEECESKGDRNFPNRKAQHEGGDSDADIYNESYFKCGNSKCKVWCCFYCVESQCDNSCSSVCKKHNSYMCGRCSCKKHPYSGCVTTFICKKCDTMIKVCKSCISTYVCCK